MLPQLQTDTRNVNLNYQLDVFCNSMGRHTQKRKSSKHHLQAETKMPLLFLLQSQREAYEGQKENGEPCELDPNHLQVS